MNINDDVLECIEYEVGRHGLEYADNYRAWRLSDNTGKADYIRAVKRGCCGFFDVVVITAKREKWLIGCNYGH